MSSDIRNKEDVLAVIKKRATTPSLTGETRIYRLNYFNDEESYFGAPLTTTYEGTNKYQIYLLIRDFLLEYQDKVEYEERDIIPKDLDVIIEESKGLAIKELTAWRNDTSTGDIVDIIVDSLIDSDNDSLWASQAKKSTHIVFSK